MSTENTHLGAARIKAYLRNLTVNGGAVYFIGIGGVMMSSLALLTRKAGHTVIGSDRATGAIMDRLRAAGITVYPTHEAAHLPVDCGLVVYTVAISPDNPEYIAARERGIPAVSRADYLGALMTAYTHRIGVAGMHGKSTCTSMCAQILLDACVDPTILSGATYAPMGGAYCLGESHEHFLFEACEYMDSFLDLSPTIAVLLGAELEHVDYFKDMEQIRNSFARFAALTGREGVTVVNADDPEIAASARRALAWGETGRVVTFSASGRADADYQAIAARTENGLPVFELCERGEIMGTVRLQVPGAHQIINALAAAAAMRAAGIEYTAILSGLAHYIGAGRRMEMRGELNGATVYDDYGHHPTEIAATLAGARALAGAAHPDGRLICVFQPHTYSRTAALYDRFLTAFDSADRVLLLDIYAAREENIYGVSSEELAKDINTTHPDGMPPKAAYAPTPAKAAAEIRRIARPGDTVVIMGAGDIIGVTALLFP